jgi:hypothetical protein
MLRITLERTLKIYKKFRACFIDWQKAFDLIKLMQIPKENFIDWNERKLIRI